MHHTGLELGDLLWSLFRPLRRMELSISDIKDITWDYEALSRLVLPDGIKELALAFAQSQIKRDHAFDDVIQGKGRGVIKLLSGPPGMGKTFTVEAVADTMQVPFYI
jgi:ATP-dependent Lon protease